MSQSSKPLIPRLRCLATLLQQLNAQTACDAVKEAIESIESTEALRQSQSLPAGAVAGLVGKWRENADALRSNQPVSDWQRAEELENAADELEQSLQADAREKGEAVFRLYPEELARMTHGPSLRAEEEDRLRSIYGDVAIPLYLHSGDYTEAMLLLEKQRELVENLRGQLDDAKADATDGCTEANCERCNTAIHSRGDMRHAGIGTYPATQPAQASEAVDSNVASVREKLLARSRFGIDKYGGTTEVNDRDYWLRHLQEELMDGAVYIEAALSSSSQETASE